MNRPDTATGPDWIGVDWGTTHLRVYGMRGATVVARASSHNGMSQLARDGFEPALMALIADWQLPDPVTVVACGMVGARQGWVEAPYARVPCPPLAPQLARVAAAAAGIEAHVIPGLSQTTPADVMRGEETQIAGFLVLNPGWDGVICLPGTHTKWAEISAGEVVSFQTFMTGELFALLGSVSVLRHSVDSQDWDGDTFDAAVSDAISRPERLAARLFSLRADDLLNATSPDHLRARLSGMLIGAELAAARPYWLGRQVAAIGTGDAVRAYDRALVAQGVAGDQNRW